MNELEKLLKEVPDTYSDFVKGCLYLAKYFDVEQKLKEYLADNKETLSSEVITQIHILANDDPKPLEIID